MVLADMARGMYARAPLWTRAALGVAMAPIPVTLLYGSAYRDLVDSIERSRVDERFTRDWRDRKLREVLSASSRAPGYAAALAEAGLGQRDPFDVLAALPVLTREQLLDAGGAAYLSRPASELDLVTTGGTAGRPLPFYLDRDRSPREWAFVNSIWSSVGYRPGDRRAVIRGIRFPDMEKGWSWDPGLRELSLSPFDLSDEKIAEFLSLIERYRIRWLHGYPSAISLVCAYALRAGWTPPEELAGCLLISEPVYRHERDLMRRALPGRSVLAFYGQSERVSMAGETLESPGVYRFEPLYGIAELVDDSGSPVERVGTRGRLVGTGFISQGMPLLRYDTGDTAELVEVAGASNNHRLAVRKIWSRYGQEYLVGKHGNLIPEAAVEFHISIEHGIREFQFFQDAPGVATLRVAPEVRGDVQAAESLRSEFLRQVSHVIDLRLEVVDEIETSPRGKRLVIDQRLKVDVPVWREQVSPDNTD